MASPRQKGFIRLQNGSLGETTFKKTNGVHRAQEKKVQNPKKFKTAPEFERVRENAEAFGNGSISAKLVKLCVKRFIRWRPDLDRFHRLKTLSSKLIKLDSVSAPGKGKITMENAKYLLGFEFNSKYSLRSFFNARFSTNVNRKTGEVQINIPSFIPTDRINVPKGTTHYKIVAAGSVIDFYDKKYVTKQYESGNMLWDDVATGDIHISLTVPPKSKLPIFIFLGLEFLEVTMGITSSVAMHSMDPLCIVDVVSL